MTTMTEYALIFLIVTVATVALMTGLTEVIDSVSQGLDVLFQEPPR